MYHGEAFCGVLDKYESLLRTILEYASTHLKDEHDLGIAAHDCDGKMQALLSELGYQSADQTETILRYSLEQEQD